MLSSFLSRYSTAAPPRSTSAGFHDNCPSFFVVLVKSSASFNAIWLHVSSLLQLVATSNDVTATAALLGWERGIQRDSDNCRRYASMLNASIGSVCLAGGSVMICVIFVYLFVNPRLLNLSCHIVGRIRENDNCGIEGDPGATSVQEHTQGPFSVSRRWQSLAWKGIVRE